MKVPAEVAKRQLQDPEGNVEDCWIVTAQEEGGMARVVFSGYQAADRAVLYAREKYFPLHFRMTADPGKYSKDGKDAQMEGMNGQEVRN